MRTVNGARDKLQGLLIRFPLAKIRESQREREREETKTEKEREVKRQAEREVVTAVRRAGVATAAVPPVIGREQNYK